MWTNVDTCSFFVSEVIFQTGSALPSGRLWWGCSQNRTAPFLRELISRSWNCWMLQPEPSDFYFIQLWCLLGIQTRLVLSLLASFYKLWIKTFAQEIGKEEILVQFFSQFSSPTITTGCQYSLKRSQVHASELTISIYILNFAWRNSEFLLFCWPWKPKRGKRTLCLVIITLKGPVPDFKSYHIQTLISKFQFQSQCKENCLNAQKRFKMMQDWHSF